MSAPQERVGQIVTPDGQTFPTRGRRTIAEKGLRFYKPPEVEAAELSDNTKAFLIGMMLGGVPVHETPWVGTGNTFVTVSRNTGNRETHASQQQQAILRAVFHQWGEVQTSARGTRIALDHNTFRFLLEPEREISYEFLRRKGRVTSLLFGMSSAQFPGRKGTQLYCRNPELLERIFRAFYSHYPGENEGSRIARFVRETARGRNNESFSFGRIKVLDPESFLRILITNRAVQELPFFRELASMENAQQETSRPAASPREVVVYQKPPRTFEADLVEFVNSNGELAERRLIAAIRTLIGDPPYDDTIERLTMQLLHSAQTDGSTPDETTRREAIDALANGLPKDDPEVQEVLRRLEAEKPRR